MKNIEQSTETLDTSDKAHLYLFFYLIPIFGFFPSLWTLYRGARGLGLETREEGARGWGLGTRERTRGQGDNQKYSIPLSFPPSPCSFPPSPCHPLTPSSSSHQPLASSPSSSSHQPLAPSPSSSSPQPLAPSPSSSSPQPLASNPSSSSPQPLATSHSLAVSRLSVTLAFTWLLAYLLLNIGAETSEFLTLRLLVLNSLLTSGYFLVSIWLMVRIASRSRVHLPGFTSLSHVIGKYLS